MAYPERSSSLKAEDWPHGPPNSPESKVTSMTEDIEAVVVAITGCSSSGKSSLAELLGTIFSQKKSLIVAQDDFFHHKAFHPMVTFKSQAKDATFMERSIHQDIGMYSISCTGVRPTQRPASLLRCLTGTRHKEHTDPFDASKSDSRAFEGERHLFYEISGPKPDCDEAIDYTRMLEAISGVKTTGQLMDYKKHFPCVEDMSKYTVLIEKMQDKVTTWVNKQAILNAEARFGGSAVRGPIENDGKSVYNDDGNGKASLQQQFVFVEGFLLLSDVTSSESGISNKKPAESTYDLAAEQTKITKYMRRLADLTVELEAAGNIDEAIEGERDIVEAQLWAVNRNAKKHMQGLFDVKMFLHTSKEEAKRRRFDRAIYKDGGGRLAGQMWKSEGYFEDVVWKGHEESYAWLLKGESDGEKDGMKKGVFIEAGEDAGIEARVEWAVDTILAEMGRMEAEARAVGGGCCLED